MLGELEIVDEAKSKLDANGRSLDFRCSTTHQPSLLKEEDKYVFDSSQLSLQDKKKVTPICKAVLRALQITFVISYVNCIIVLSSPPCPSLFCHPSYLRT